MLVCEKNNDSLLTVEAEIFIDDLISLFSFLQCLSMKLNPWGIFNPRIHKYRVDP